METPALLIGLTINTYHINQMISQMLDKDATRLETHDISPLVEVYGIRPYLFESPPTAATQYVGE